MSDRSVKERIRERKQNAVDPEAFLKDVGAIRMDPEAEALAFTETLAGSIDEQVDVVDATGVSPDEIAELFGVPRDDVAEPDRPYTAYKVIHTIWNWPSESALILDIATDAAVGSLTDRWAEVPPRQRYRILQAMRGFHDRCPFCGGSLILDESLVPSCCSDRDVVTIHCEACSRRFLEFSPEQTADDGTVPPSASIP